VGGLQNLYTVKGRMRIRGAMAVLAVAMAMLPMLIHAAIPPKIPDVYEVRATGPPYSQSAALQWEEAPGRQSPSPG
jgi:hypothetical protein